MSGYASGEGASGFKDIVTDPIQPFLQSCKNSLRSAVVLHFIGEGSPGDLFEKFFSVFHHVLP